ncbi:MULTISPECIES: DUF5337 domain-containing protein [unclassified Paracoccus (in: a-proteobacteria)]|uniref:DUF5337 domain-containing protein n=1 Tax=unclassified Paracoccus (in: a-proteobacteria) TaxID=2688777 RepID=UPI0012B34B54|nr:MULTISPECIES: DUF5337 domain-containing protein [unclassified Paracoccus (in: a-proteobacteria)]UXU75214.1 DUF5337 domain-containing protein [Paracoccus sp. SMMA_5]UXU81116.1 DUF5337 domain-containing protein [Paracoccus sp. SMMA_5_TC]
MTRPDRNQLSSPASAAADAGQMRLVAVVIAVTILLWLGVQWLGGRMGWPAKYAFLADLMAIGALIWSLLVTWRIWRRRNASSQRQG